MICGQIDPIRFNFIIKQETLEKYKCSLKLNCIHAIYVMRYLMSSSCKMMIIFTVAFVRNKEDNFILNYMAYKKQVVTLGLSIFLFHITHEKKILQDFQI